MESSETRPAAPIEEALELEEIDVDLFRSKRLWKPADARGVFGGQVVGLALAAAQKTITESFSIHSLHCYFVLAGDPSTPILYRIRRIRDGRSYATRLISARQRGKDIFIAVASFQVPEVSKLIHSSPMPVVPPPESVKSMEERLRGWLEEPSLSSFHRSIRLRLQQPIPIDLRRINPKKMEGAKPATQYVWMKAKGKLPTDLSFHRSVLAYCSDHYLLNTTLVPHGDLAFPGSLKMMASLDHAIWFHEPFCANDWLLYEMESPKANGGRGLAFGRIFTQDGRLVASTAQEGVIRVGDKTKIKAKL